jgi:hypothetical protein
MFGHSARHEQLDREKATSPTAALAVQGDRAAARRFATFFPLPPRLIQIKLN